MTQSSKSLLFWSPRIATILFVLFLGMFAMDVFGEGRGFWSTIMALALHLLPSIVMFILLLIAWKWELVGTVAFAALGVFYAYWASSHLDWVLAISGPLFLISVLYLLDWLLRKRRPEKMPIDEFLEGKAK